MVFLFSSSVLVDSICSSCMEPRIVVKLLGILNNGILEQESRIGFFWFGGQLAFLAEVIWHSKINDRSVVF